MGCLRAGALVVLGPLVGGFLGYKLGGSLIPVPDWALNLILPHVTRDPRVDTVRGLALAAGRIWGGMNGAFWGLVVGIALAALLAYRSRTR